MELRERSGMELIATTYVIERTIIKCALSEVALSQRALTGRA